MLNQLRTIMAQRGMTGIQLARAAGVSDAAICRYAQGERTPPIDIAYRIAFALGCDVRDVFPPILTGPKRKAG